MALGHADALGDLLLRAMIVADGVDRRLADCVAEGEASCDELNEALLAGEGEGLGSTLAVAGLHAVDPGADTMPVGHAVAFTLPNTQ